MSNTRADFENVLPFAKECLQNGESICIVTIVSIEGVSPRPLGSQMIVSESGERFGMLTGGCAEKAISEQAVQAILERQNQTIRIGSDSPWVDIRLPCGSGIDLHFSVVEDKIAGSWIDQALSTVAQRISCEAILDLESGEWMIGEIANEQEDFESCFQRSYFPRIRLNIVGAGPYVESLVRLSEQMNFEISVWSHDENTLVQLPEKVDCQLSIGKSENDIEFDEWTALTVLFHEHDREFKYLEKALESDCFYIGALGSKKTQRDRLAELSRRGFNEKRLSRISGPIGLDILAKSPDEIAISVLAELVLKKNEKLASSAINSFATMNR